MNTLIKNKRGLIDTVVLIVVALIILGYFKIDVREIVNTPVVKDNLHYAWELVVWAFGQLRDLAWMALK